MKKKKKEGEEGDSPKEKKSDSMNLTLVKGCTYTDGENKYVPEKKYAVSKKDGERLLASGAFRAVK